MKRKARTRILSLMLVLAMCLSLTGNMVLGVVAEGTENYHDGGKELYLPLNDLTNVHAYGGTGIYGNFADSSDKNKVMLLQNPGDFVECNIDMDDSIREATLKLNAADVQVQVKAADGQFQTLTAENGTAFNRNVAFYKLNEENALSGAEKKFTVRIEKGAGTGILNSLLVQAESAELTGTYTMDPLGKNYMQQVVDVSAGATRFFDNGVPTVQLRQNEYVTFYFDYSNDAESISYSYGIAGATPLTGEYSTDGTAWTALSAAGGKLENLNTDRTFYLRFTAKDGQTFLKNLVLTPVIKTFQKVDQELYLSMKDLSGAAGYSDKKPYENFNDQNIGGSAATNPVMLLQSEGEFVEYNFDLANDVKSAALKLSITGGKVEVKPAGGEFVTLAPSNGTAFDRGTAIFSLTENDALAGEDNKFTLRISFNGSTAILNGMLIQTGMDAITKAYTTEAMGASFLRNLQDVSGTAGRYFLNGSEPTLFLHNGEHATFRYTIDPESDGATVAFEQAGAALTMEYSINGSTWSVMTSGSQIKDKDFFIRFTAANGEGFLRSVTVTPVEPVYTQVEGELYLPMNDLTGTSGYNGTVAENFNDTYQGGTVENKTMLLQAAGDYVEYNLDLPDSLKEAALKLSITGGKVEVKPAGGRFTTLTAVNGTGFNRGTAIYTLNSSNALAAASNKFTLRISFDGSTAVLNGLLLQTETAKAGQIGMLGQDFLQAVTDLSAGATRYFLNGTVPTVQLHTGESATFRFALGSDAEGATVAFDQAGNALTAQVSTDGSTWTALASGQSVKGGDLYVKFTAEAGDAFLSGITVTPVEPVYTAVDTALYLPLNDLTGAANYNGTVYENFSDTFQGGTVTNSTMLLQAAGDFVEYHFDMADSVTEAALKLSITGGKVEVKPAGGTYTTLTATNGTGFNRGTAIYKLDGTNALAADSNKFTLRISFDGSTAVLNGLLLHTDVAGVGTVDMLGENYLRAISHVSAGATRYFADGTVPTVQLHTGEQITFRFAVDADKAKLIFAQLGNPLTAEVSADGTTFTAITSGAEVAHGNFYVRFTANAGDAFLSAVTVSAAEAVYLDAGKGMYLPLNDLTGASSYNGDIAQNFNDTFQGGTGTNQTMLLQKEGEFVEYNFDMDDSLTAVTLKLAITGGKVEVKPAGGEFTTLTAVNGTGFNRGTAIYALDETNALAADSNKFTLRISFDGSTVVLNGLLLQSAVAKAGSVGMLGEDYLAAVTQISSGVTRYFADGIVPTLQIHNGEAAVFHMTVADADAQGAKISFQQLGQPLTAQVSPDGQNWAIITSGSEVSYKDIYVRFTAEAGDGFLSSLTVTPTYAVVEEKAYVYLDVQDLSSASRFGGTPAENFVDTFLGGDSTAVNPTLLLQTTADYAEYDINLPDDATAATLKLYMKHGVVSVKPKGGDYITLTAKNGTSFDRNVAIYDLTESDALASADRQFTVRISCDGTNAVVLNGLMVQTALAESSTAYKLDVLGESFMHNLQHISGTASRYFLNGGTPTVFLHTGESAIFAFDFADDVESLVYSYAAAGMPLTAQISYDAQNWVALPGGGRIEDALALNENRTFYLAFTAATGDSFLHELTLTPAEPEVQVEADYVYVPIYDLTGTSGYGGAGIYGNFEDTFTGGEDGKTGNKTLLLQQAGDYVDYDFNLTDSRTAARLKVYMTDAVVSVKPYGGEFQTLTAVNEAGDRFNRGVAVYDLTTANALSHESRRFTVRIACNGSATAVLNGLVMDAANSFPTDTYTLAPLGESYLQGLWETSQSTSRYFDQGQYPTVFLQPGGYATFRMNFAPDGAAYLLNYQNLGTALTVEVSLDNANWVTLKGQRVDRALDVAETGTFYVRFTSNAGESFLSSLVASREETEPPVKENTNPNAPVDVGYVYFQVGTSAEEKYMFGTGEDYKASFLSTHQGMDIDGFEGGYSTSLRKNARVFHGGSVTYEFDLKDEMTAANLKIYGLADMEFLVSTDNGETYDPIYPSDAPTGNARGYYIFRINENNALKGEDNKFRLRIQGTFGVLMSLMIENGIPGTGSGVHFQIDGENSLRYLDSTKGLRTYYADKAFANYYLDRNSEMIFRVPISSDAILYATYCGDLQIAVASSRYGHYTPVLNSKLGTTGTPHTNTVKLSDYIGGSSVAYILVKSNGGDAFLDSFGISNYAAEQTKGTISAFGGSEARAIYSINNNAQGIGTAKRVTSGLSKARGIDVGGEIIYRLNLPDDVGGVDVLLNARGQYDLSASIDGETFYSAVQLGKKDEGLRILEPLVDSEDKVFYLKITNTSASDDLILYSIQYTTEGVPNYVRPQTGEFDYGKDLPDSFPTVEKLEKAKDPDAYLLEAEGEQLGENGFPWIWVTVIGGGVVVLAGLLLLILLLKKKKKDQQA